MFRLTPSVLFPALGETMSERSGVYNVGLEGYMLMGALTGYLGTYLTGNLAVGMLFGILTGMALSALHAYFVITHKANQILSGIAIWIFGMGLSAYLFRAINISSGVSTFEPVVIPGLSSIPGLGPVLFSQNAMVYLVLVMAGVFWFILFKTPFGLITRATGDNPLSVDIAGHNVFRIRYYNVLIAGAMAGMGGACMSLVTLNTFVENMVAGRGFVALALVIFGNWNPAMVLGAALIFTFVDALQINIQAAGSFIPYPFLLMLPYIVAMIILVFSGRKATGAAYLFIPYTKGQS